MYTAKMIDGHYLCFDVPCIPPWSAIPTLIILHAIDIMLTISAHTVMELPSTELWENVSAPPPNPLEKWRGTVNANFCKHSSFMHSHVYISPIVSPLCLFTESWCQQQICFFFFFFFAHAWISVKQDSTVNISSSTCHPCSVLKKSYNRALQYN